MDGRYDWVCRVSELPDAVPREAMGDEIMVFVCDGFSASRVATALHG